MRRPAFCTLHCALSQARFLTTHASSCAFDGSVRQHMRTATSRLAVLTPPLQRAGSSLHGVDSSGGSFRSSIGRGIWAAGKRAAGSAM